MKASKRRRVEFFQQNPLCCYCGGLHRAEERDHAPPRVLFRNKQRPRGLEVPSCQHCNRLFAPFDSMFALIALTMASAIDPRLEARLPGLISSSVKRFPEAVLELAGRGGKRRLYNEYKGLLRPAVMVRFQHEDLHFVINYMTARLSAAVYYERTKKVLPVGTKIASRWWSNAQPPAPQLLEGILENTPNLGALIQGSQDTSEQFQYRTVEDPKNSCGMFAFNFFRQMMTVGIVFPPETIEEPEELALFSIGPDGIEPENRSFPDTVTIAKRRQGKAK